MRKILAIVVLLSSLLLLVSCVETEKIEVPTTIVSKRQYTIVQYTYVNKVMVPRYVTHYEFTITYTFENDFVQTVTNVRKQIYDEYQEGDIYYMKIKVRK